MVAPSTALESLSIRNFRGIDHLDLAFVGPDGLPNPLVVLAGPNGSGKTAVLEAALIAAGGTDLLVGASGRRAVRKGADDYRIEATLQINGSSHEIQATSDAPPPTPRLPHWYFSSWRAPLHVGSLGVTVGKPGRKPRKNDANRLWNVKQILVNAAAKAHFPGEQRSFIHTYNDWMETIHQAWLEFYPESDGRFEVEIVDPSDAEADAEGVGAFDLYYKRAGAPRLEIDYLSAGQLELFLFLAALVLNDGREGIVFIDEPELHLDPQWHRLIVRSLVRLQPNAQFIVATHSPQIYDAARSYERHFLVPDDDPRARLWPTVGAGA